VQYHVDVFEGMSSNTSTWYCTRSKCGTSSLKFFTVRETVVLEHMQGVPLHKSRGTVCLQVWGYVCYVCTQDACKV